MKTISSYTELSVAICNTPIEFTKGPRAKLLARAFHRYHAAYESSKAFGLVGVGCISFANARLAKFCRIVGLEG